MFCIYRASFTFIQQIVCRHDITEILMKVVLNTILLKLYFLQNNTNYFPVNYLLDIMSPSSSPF